MSLLLKNFSQSKTVSPKASGKTSPSLISIHPFRLAMEYLKAGDQNFSERNWSLAKHNYTAALTMIEEMPIIDSHYLKTCLIRKAKCHLRLFELFAALMSYLQTLTLETHSKSSLPSEEQNLVDSIKESRRFSMRNIECDYTPRSFGGHF